MLVIGFHHNATYSIGYLLGQPSVNVSETDEKLATPAHYCALHDSMAYIGHFSDKDLVARDIRNADFALWSHGRWCQCGRLHFEEIS